MKIMRKFNLLLVAFVSLTIGLSSCVDPVADPVITITSANPMTIDLSMMDVPVLIGGITIDVNDSFESVTFVSTFEDGTTATIEDNSATGAAYVINKTADQLGAKEGMKEVTITVKTAKAETDVTKTIAVTIVPAETALITKDFAWHRVGGDPGTGDLAVMGLAWTSNTGTHIIIKTTDGTTLVQLTEEDWAIATEEALIEAFNAATPIATFELIPAKDDTKDFNYVLATKKADGTYSLINPTKRVLVGTHDRTVTGKYKVVE